jgi:GT2 family glycosyltransferase
MQLHQEQKVGFPFPTAPVTRLTYHARPMSPSRPATALIAEGGPPRTAGPHPLLEPSRARLLGSLGEAEHVTFVRSVGNLGDELIFAGIRRILGGRASREIGIDGIARAEGEVAVLAGGGAWCRPYHELLPRLLPRLEERFSRVVIFPSSFDPGVPEVRRALVSTRAKVFAREEDSFRLIRDLCDANLALDAAFFFDYDPYLIEGSGTLVAFRGDQESSGRHAEPPGNRDISVACSSLDEWLWTIARCARVRTDRAHVMIAAALLGKRVLYRASSYHKVPAIAEWALVGYPVCRDEPGAEPPSAPERVSIPAAGGPGDEVRSRLLLESRRRLALAIPFRGMGTAERPRVTVMILTRNRPGLAREAVRSVLRNAGMPCRVLLLDNGSRGDLQDELRREFLDDAGVDFLALDRNLGCAGGRAFALTQAGTEFVMFLDDDAEILPGTVAHLVRELDAHPEALAVTPTVVLPSGAVQHCGGRFETGGGVVRFELLGTGEPFEGPGLGRSGPCGWVPGTATMGRREAFHSYPLDPGMTAYYEDNEWCFRVAGEKPAAFRRSVEALVIHRHEGKERIGGGPDELARLVPYVMAAAHFHRRHGLVLESLFGWLPELRRADGRPDVATTRRLLELVTERGGDWLRDWLTHGGLDWALAARTDRTPRPLLDLLLMYWGTARWRFARARGTVLQALRRLFIRAAG